MPENDLSSRGIGDPKPPTVDILQRKANVLIEALDKGIQRGALDPYLPALFMHHTPDTHTDLMLVYLGLRPMAEHLGMELAVRNPDFHRAGYTLHQYLRFLPQGKDGGTDLRFHEDSYVGDIHAVWNPENTAQVLSAHTDLFDPRWYDPSSPSFNYWIENVSKPGRRTIDEVRYGVVQGIPRADAEGFTEFAPLLDDLCDSVEEAARLRKIELFPEESLITPFGQLINDMEVRDRVVKFIEELGEPIDPTIMNYLKTLRPAQVPGFRYTTSGPVSAHERMLAENWNASGLPQKLEELISKYSS